MIDIYQSKQAQVSTKTSTSINEKIRKVYKKYISLYAKIKLKIAAMPSDTPKVKVKKTGEIKTAVYARNSRGNLQFWVDGKFYNDILFNRNFKII